MKIRSDVYWDQGRRKNNQDSLALLQVLTNRGRVLLAVVSDGIGGLQEGETASGYITERLIEIFYGELVPLVGRGKGRKALTRSLLRCLYGIRQELNRYAVEREFALGATVSLVFLWKRNYLMLHLGDSRIYLCKDRKQRLLTTDHSDGRNGLTACLGSFPFKRPDIRWGKIWGKGGFLLCTDGFYRKLDQEMLALLAPSQVGSDEQIEKRLQAIAGALLKKGERDNLSAVYVMVR